MMELLQVCIVHHFFGVLLHFSPLTVQRTEYLRFLRLLIASMYAFSVQGRIGGIKSLNLRHGHQLEEHGYVGQQDFKTEEFYLVQPVIIPRYTMPLFKFYLNMLRPKVASDCPGLQLPESPLWISYTDKKARKTNRATRGIMKRALRSVGHNRVRVGGLGRTIGKRMEDVLCNDRTIDLGRLVKEFYMKTMNLKLGSTSLRKIMETTASSMQSQGVITPQQRAAVAEINGHSVRTADDVYVAYQPRRSAQQSAQFVDTYDQMLQQQTSTSKFACVILYLLLILILLILI